MQISLNIGARFYVVIRVRKNLKLAICIVLLLHRLERSLMKVVPKISIPEEERFKSKIFCRLIIVYLISVISLI